MIARLLPTSTPCVFHVETAFPRRFNVEYAWCLCWVANVEKCTDKCLPNFLAIVEWLEVY